ncbi:TonB C-terminal domain-containing protein [Helicobacter typhlonius]|uniref:TonB C-terminal domain-containing protein n=1 Tax=Helicobacter typhlonius TaxID=76936 RepID=UPI002FE3BCC9
MNNALLFITSGIISFCIYSLLIIALVFTLFRSNPTHYAALNESALSLHAISIEAIIDDKPTPSKSSQPALNSPLAGSGVKDMFSKIDSDIPAQNAEIGDNREKVEQNSKEQKLKDLQASAESLQKQLNTLSNLTISANTNQSDGEYDEWYAQIEKMMFQQWQQTFYVEEKLQALVHIVITSNGNFSYKVVKYAGNVAFDDSLKAMLEECIKIHFPPHPKGKREIAITFKN